MGYRQAVVLPMLPWAGSVLWFLNRRPDVGALGGAPGKACQCTDV